MQEVCYVNKHIKNNTALDSDMRKLALFGLLLFVYSTTIKYVAGNENDVPQRLKDGAVKLEKEMQTLVDKNLGYDILQVIKINWKIAIS